MAEKQFKVRPMGVEYVCDECGKGKMLPIQGATIPVNPPLYPHKCNQCDAVINLKELYPKINFVDTRDDKKKQG